MEERAGVVELCWSNHKGRRKSAHTRQYKEERKKTFIWLAWFALLALVSYKHLTMKILGCMADMCHKVAFNNLI